MIGVVILGFVIGAGLSVARRGGLGGDSAGLATSTPLVIQTLAAATPSAEPPPATEPPPSATPRAGPTQAPSPAPRASAPSSQSPTATAAAVAVVSAAPSPARTAAPANTPSAAPTAAPTAEPTREPTETPTAQPTAVPTAAAVSVDADSDFARLAGNVVRQYLLSIARGDTTSAYAVLSPAPGAGSAAPEVGAIDSSLRISKIEARGSDVAATVNVDLTTASGPYSGQYTVHRSATGAAIIVSHTFGKP